MAIDEVKSNYGDEAKGLVNPLIWAFHSSDAHSSASQIDCDCPSPSLLLIVMPAMSRRETASMLGIVGLDRCTLHAARERWC